MKRDYTAFLFTLFFAVAILNAFSQSSIEWQKSFGGSGIDIGNSIEQTSDGGYIVAGYSYSNDGDVTSNHGGSDFWIVKLSNVGSIQWQKSFGGTNDEEAYTIKQTIDGGYIVAGKTYSNDQDVTFNHGSSDLWIIKLDTIGIIQWQKSFGGTAYEGAFCVQQTSDNGYIVAGESGSNDGDVSGNHGQVDYWILKLDSVGNKQWQKSLGGTDTDAAYSINQTTDGGFIVAGYSFSNNGNVMGNHGSTDYWIVKLNSIGTIEWQKSLGGTNYDSAISIQQAIDGGYIIAGRSWSNDGDVTGWHSGGYCGGPPCADYWIVKLDSSGSIQWQKSFGGSEEDDAYSIQQTNDGGYIVGGESYSNNGDASGNNGSADYWMVKIDSVGIIQWQKSLGGSFNDFAYSIQQTTDGEFIVAGYSDSNDSDVTAHHGNTGTADYWLVKLSPTVGIEEQYNPFIEIQLSPNPATNHINIHFSTLPKNKPVKLIIRDILGKKLYNSSINNLQSEIDISLFPIGVYFVEVEIENSMVMRKFVKD